MFKTVQDMKKGDVVRFDQGLFVVLEDGRPSRSDSTVFVARSECVLGSVPGYYRPGKEWIFQGSEFRFFNAVGREWSFFPS